MDPDTSNLLLISGAVILFMWFIRLCQQTIVAEDLRSALANGQVRVFTVFAEKGGCGWLLRVRVQVHRANGHGS